MHTPNQASPYSPDIVRRNRGYPVHAPKVWSIHRAPGQATDRRPGGSYLGDCFFLFGLSHVLIGGDLGCCSG